MNIQQEFLKFATKHRNINSNTLNDYTRMFENTTPYIIEERQMNMIQMDVFSRLMMDRIIFLGTGIDYQISNIVTAQLLFLESLDAKRDIQIFVNSPGGSITDGLSIYDTMQYVAPDVSTMCTGMAASMGAVLLAAGKKGKRSCLKHSRIMIHQPLGGMQGQAKDMEITYNFIKSLQKDLYDILSYHTGQPYDKIEEDCDRDNWMRGDEAVAYGLIDEVLIRK
jgi:ATP-dependent Clp protease protease subunit